MGIGDGAPGGFIQVVPETEIEQQGEADPHQRPAGGLLQGHGVRAFTALQQEVDCEHHDDDGGEAAP